MKTSKRKREVKSAEGSVDAHSQAPALKLASTCTIKDVAVLKAQLLALVSEERDIAVDVSQVERIDTATLQVLCAFARERSAGKRPTVWSGGSAGWEQAIKLLGVAELLGATTAKSQEEAA